MSEFDTYLASHPMSEPDQALVRAALKTLSQLRDAGLANDDSYRLAPTFGAPSESAPQRTLAALREIGR
jgi:hypothetical protein